MTNSDIRLQTSWYSNLKRKKLQNRLGGDGTTAFIDLLIYVGINNPDGILTGFDEEDIEMAAQWNGESGAFTSALIDLRFLDGKSGKYKIHDWEENNPWACGSKRRSQAARKANEVRWGAGDSESDKHPTANAGSIRAASEPDESGVPLTVSDTTTATITDTVTSPKEYPSAIQDFVKYYFGSAISESDFGSQCDALDKMVRIDNIPQQDIFDALRWVKTGDDEGARFWRTVTNSFPSLRISKNGRKLNKWHNLKARYDQETKSGSQRTFNDVLDDDSKFTNPGVRDLPSLNEL